MRQISVVLGSLAVVAGAVLMTSPTAADAASTHHPSTTHRTGNATITDAQVAAERRRLDRTATDVGPSPAMTPAQRSALRRKDEAAAGFLAGSGGITAFSCPASDPCKKSPPASATVPADQVAQTTTYFCGPAAVEEALDQRAIASSQSHLANAMATTTDGTAWSGIAPSSEGVADKWATGHPIPDVINDRLGRHKLYNNYVPVAVDYFATTAQKKHFRTRLQADVARHWPLVGDAYEVPGGPHLVGHPTNLTIFHWFDIRGYARSGATTRYEDSVSGSSTSWAGGVPAYSSMSSNTIAVIVGGRGYVW